MLSLPQQGFPVTCRSGHCCVCSPLLFASDILCDLPTVNRGWIQLAQGPVTKNIALQIFESASLLVCKSASLQVCRSAFVAHRCLTRTTIDSRQCCSFVAQTCLQICVCRTPICHTYNYWLTAMLLICCPNLPASLYRWVRIIPAHFLLKNYSTPLKNHLMYPAFNVRPISQRHHFTTWNSSTSI